MSLNEAIDSVLENNPHGDPLDLADEVLSLVDKSDLVSIVADRIQNRQRQRTRDKERSGVLQLLSKATPRTVSVVLATAPVEQVERLLSLSREPLRLGSGLTTEWGKATLLELRERREMLLKQRNGIDDTIKDLDVAIGVLEKHGATCLDDVIEKGLVAA